ncbi:MAG TPA: YkgJ family cysteine cluster protein [Deltaproteobacteria bacterium]|nr:YkgJ family cysteine cluster protein [Deltaproteobacteria bacterium]
MKPDHLFTEICFEHYNVYVPFECRRCGKRCRTYTPRIAEDTLEEIAHYLGKPSYDVRFIYEERYKKRYRSDALPCPFFKGETNECGIYPLRPECCRLYPFSFGGGDTNCQAYRRHIRIVSAIKKQDQYRDTYDSSFCPNQRKKPIPGHKWPDILYQFMLMETSYLMILKFIRINTISTRGFGTPERYSYSTT